jgi:DNA-binding response OmpR family regulator
MPNILIVEDDQDLSEIAKIHLTSAGHAIKQAFCCETAKALIESEYFDLVLLDIMLPDGSGQDVCTHLRGFSTCPVIYMSCLEDSATIVSSLERGGDDYMTKPIRYDELLARIDANIRRFRSSLTGERIRGERMRGYAGFTIDTLRRRGECAGEELCLTQIEYALLDYLSGRPGELILYDDLYRSVWDNDSLGDVRTLMVHMSNLRRKIDPEHRGIIENIRGAGYLFTDV